MTYPSTVSNFNRPTTTDTLNNPSHSALHNAVSSAVSQIETFVGTTSSAAGTLIYDIRAAASDGGGHVQSAAKGGTGQTTYTKGDVLVAQNSSTLTRLAVGTDGQALVASSIAATGITWATPGGTKIAVSGSVVTVSGSGEQSIMSVSIPGSTIGTNNAVRATVFLNALQTSQNSSTFRANYGSTSIATITMPTPGANVSSINGTIECVLAGRGSASSQLGTVTFFASRNQTGLQSTSILGIMRFQASNPINENSSAARTLGFTATIGDGSAPDRLDTGGYIVERIV